MEELLNKLISIDSITRVEVIEVNNGGRKYVNTNVNNNVQISLQDDCRTLKIFIDDTRK